MIARYERLMCSSPARAGAFHISVSLYSARRESPQPNAGGDRDQQCDHAERHWDVVMADCHSRAIKQAQDMPNGKQREHHTSYTQSSPL